MSDKEKVSQWMIERGYATGHGDTIEELLKELEWQAVEREREACAKLCEDVKLDLRDIRRLGANGCIAAIRARGEK